MKLLLISTLLALLCIARSAPPSSSQDRTLILPDYDAEPEIVIDPNEDEDEDDDANTTTTTTTTTATTRRSTYVFPTRARPTPTFRRPWLTQRTTTVREIEIDLENIGSDEYESGFGYFKNIREFFKRLFDDAKKFFKKVIGFDIIKAIKQFFNGKIDD